jgi:hypothetical protein
MWKILINIGLSFIFFISFSTNVIAQCEGDFDNDGDVDQNDLAIFALDFGRSDCGTISPCEGDIHPTGIPDGDVDASDLTAFITDFGNADCSTAFVHIVGRMDNSDPIGPKFTWPASLFQTRIYGSNLDIELDGSAGVYFQVVVDGINAPVIQTLGGRQRYAIVAGATVGVHDVQVYRRNEGFFGSVQFIGFVPGTDTYLLESNHPWKHKIEFIGDAITCGYGILGVDGYCSFSPITESAYMTYAAVAARDLEAEAHLIAYSGKGVFQNYDGSTADTMTDLYKRTSVNDTANTWDFSRWIPDVVVVFLGASDFASSISYEQFVPAYSALLGDIRLYYPNAKIICIIYDSWYNTDYNWVIDAVNQSGDANTFVMNYNSNPANGYGCDWHPSIATHQELGSQLSDYIKGLMGW